MNIQTIQLQAEVPENLKGQRLDAALAIIFPEHSRSRLKQWIEDGKILVNGKSWRAKDKVQGGESVVVNAELESQTEWKAEALPLTILFEDPDILILNKPANCVVHPAKGNASGTLVNALLHHIPALCQIPRAGIVHRLDKDTTGLLIVAKTLEAMTSLSHQIQKRTLKRIYEAIVSGVMISGGTIHTKMGRHPRERIKMAVVEDGKEAITYYRVLTRFLHHTHVQVQLETGRTHQIRVHMAHIDHPIVGDKLYGGRLKIPPKALPPLVTALRTFPRQALHAKKLTISHPKTKEEMTWEIPLPEDMQALLGVLKPS